MLCCGAEFYAVGVASKVWKPEYVVCSAANMFPGVVFVLGFDSSSDLS